MAMGIEIKGPDGTVQRFMYQSTELDFALQTGQPGWFTVVAGVPSIWHPYSKERFQGGWLIGGCPLNLFTGGGWLPGQIEALKAAGKKPTCRECVPGTRCFEQFYGAAVSAELVAAESGSTSWIHADPSESKVFAAASPSVTPQADTPKNTGPWTFSPSVTVTGGGGGGGASPFSPAAADTGAASAGADWLADNWFYVVAGLGVLLSSMKGRR